MTPGNIDIQKLQYLQLDALREVANIGAGHAATALSQLTQRRIMVNVPNIQVARLEDVPELLGEADEVVAAVLMHMLGDLTGRTLLIFPRRSAIRLAEILLGRSQGSSHVFSELEQSAIKEVGNILSAAYLNALSDFMGMMLMPSVPSLVIDLSAAVLTSAYMNFGSDRDYVFAIQTNFSMEQEASGGLEGHFLLLPDVESLGAILEALRLS
jgi:chemotaxis protein CheC